MKEISGYSPSKDPRLINCKTECGNERCFAKRYGLFAEKTCPNFKEPKPITNADRIRAMSDEELAEWFIKIQNDVADYYDSGHAYAPELPTMKESWLDWLRQEADNGQN